jgi:hypothetical protein
MGTAMIREVKNPGRPGYRVIRSTVVLAENSAAIRKIMDKDLRRVLKKVAKVNYDFAQLADADLEVLYGYFDDKFMEKVKDEFIFVPHSGAIRDNHGCVAICCLCGKGDSKDTDDNEDHIRYEFLLTNTAGGNDIWCGGTCIINYGLKVKGAATAEEAKRLLEKTLREHKRQWMIEQWQAANGDHEQIPEQYQQFRRMPYMLRMHGVLYDNFGELQLSGFDMDATRTAAEDTWKEFRSASRFYQRHGFLTETKMESWTNAKNVLQYVAEMQNILSVAEGVIDPNERFEYFIKIGKARKAEKHG